MLTAALELRWLQLNLPQPQHMFGGEPDTAIER
jgi:hypothetical protein